MRAAITVLAALSLVLFVAAMTVDRWLFVVLKPAPFDERVLPPAPDYGSPSAWAALPETPDGADVQLAALPALPRNSAPADVFYVHPTTWLGGTSNGPIDDPAQQKAVERGGTLIQASAFNACCDVYAPRYRQAHGRHFVHIDEDAQRAIDVAYGDVARAFDVFLRRTGDRPFLIAGHSQGAAHATRLVRERVLSLDGNKRFVAAYLIGAPVRDLPVCTTPEQNRCIVSYNARGPRFRPGRMGFDVDHLHDAKDWACTSPIDWSKDGKSAGAVFFDTAVPSLKPDFADGRCEGGTLVVTRLGNTERDVMSTILLWVMGPENYHPIEYQLFYADLRQNAVARVSAEH